MYAKLAVMFMTQQKAILMEVSLPEQHLKISQMIGYAHYAV